MCKVSLPLSALRSFVAVCRVGLAGKGKEDGDGGEAIFRM